MATNVTFVESRVSDLAPVSSGGPGGGDRYMLSPDEDDMAAIRRILAGYSDLEAITVDGGGLAGLLPGGSVSVASSWTYRAEGATGSVPFTFVVTRTGDTGTTESVDWAVAGAGPSPATADDFLGGVLPSGTVTFAPGETSKTIAVAVQADSTAEPEEGFTVGLSNASAGIVIDRATASATIIDEVGTRFVVSIDPDAQLSTSSTLRPIFSPDGEKVAFQGYADDLVPGDTNDDPDFFVKDLITGVVVRVSTDSTGGQGDGDGQNNSDPISFSPDSTKVLFGSLASGLVPGDTNGKYDIFIKDLTTGTTTRVSTDATGAEANDQSHQPMFSPDGTKVVFRSSATNLVPGDTNGKQDIFVKDLITGTITRVSTNAAGAQSNGQSDQPVFSPDGTKVAFISTATDLVSVDSNGAFGDLFIKDLVTGAIVLASTNDAGVQAALSVTAPQFSPDGTKVLFSSTANNLVAGDTNSASDIFVKDLITGVVSRASTDALGGQANGGSFDASFSPDGTRVSFRSLASNLVGGDTNAVPDIFVKDLTTGAIQRISTNASGVQGDAFSVGKSNFSPDGKRLIFTSDATNLVTGDTNGFVDAFIADLNLVSVAATDAVRAEGPSGTTLFSFTVSRTGVIIHPLSVDWAVTGTGVHPADAADFGGTLPSGTVFLAGSEPSTIVTVAVSSDAAIEFDETFGIKLSNPSVTDFMIGTATATGVIQNDDIATVSIAASAATQSEGDSGGTPFVFTVTLAGEIAESRTVDWAVSTSGGQAGATPADFVGGAFPAGTLTFQPGQTTRSIEVMVAGDEDVEGADVFTVTLSNPAAGLAIGTKSADGSIENDDTFVTFLGPVEQAEGNGGSTAFVFTLVARGDLSVAHSVSWAATGSGSNAADASDFAGNVLPGGTVTLDAGGITTITVLVAGDATIEADETFGIALSNPSAGLAIFEGATAGTIQNDDSASVSIAALSAAKAEENTGTIPFTFEVTLSQAGLVMQTVAWMVTGTGEHAADGGDFVGGALPSGTVTFAAGETSQTITLPVSGDTVVEFDDFFLVTLFNPSPGLALGTASALGVAQNDDRARISIAPLAAGKSEGDSGTTAFTFTVSLDQASFAAQTADWSVTGAGGNAADAADFGGVLPSGTLSFAAGETSKVVTVLVSGDTAAEFNEDFAVTLSNLTFGLMPGTASATGTILNDDKSVVSVTAGPGSKAEGTGGTKTFAWTVSLDRAGVTSQTVAWAIGGSGAHAADGTDLAGGVLPSGTLTFAPGETVKTVIVDVAGDTTVEFDEGLVLTVSAPSSGLDLGTTTMAGTIANDDLSAVSIAAQSASAAEGNSGGTPFTFTVKLDQPSTSAQTADWTVTGSGAHGANAADFGGVLPGGTVTFAPGQIVKTVTINVAGDMDVEFDENFTVTLANPSAGLSLAAGAAISTIVTDDAKAYEPHLVPTLSIPVASAWTAVGIGIVATADLNQDGHDDIIASGLTYPGAPNDAGNVPQKGVVLFGDGLGGFTPAPEHVFPLLWTVHPRQIVSADFNGDGRPDVFVASHGYDTNPFPGEQNRLYLSQPNGTWIDVTSSLPQRLDFTHSAAAGDIDGDGDLDIYVGNIHGQQRIAPYLLINDGSGLFSIATDALPNRTGQSLDLLQGAFTSSLLADLDRDGLPDLIVGSFPDPSNATSMILWNTGGVFDDGQRTELPASALPTSNRESLSIAAIDIDRDGYLDLVTLSSQRDPYYVGTFIDVFINQKNRTFTNATSAVIGPTASQALGAWSAFLTEEDVNGDYLPDLVMSTYVGPQGASEDSIYVLVNDGAGHLTPVTLGQLSSVGEPVRYAAVALNSNGIGFVSLYSLDGKLYANALLSTQASVSIEATSANRNEGDTGPTAYEFTVSISQASATTQTVMWTVAGAGAREASASDFVGGVLPAGTVTFAAGETSKVVTIQVAGDSVGESHESFLVSLSNPSSGLELGTATAGGTILDDDGSVSIAAQSAAKAEGTGGTTAFTFTVTTTGDASTTRSVAWAVSGSGASKADAADFAGGTLPTGVLTFAAGETSKALTITVAGDTAVEPDEGFLVSLSNPSSSLKIGTGSASGTIQNDDSLPVTVTAHDDAYIVLEGQSLTIAAASGVLFNDQSASSASLLANAGHGAVQLAGTGGFGYTPTAGFTGVDSFTYHAVPGGNGVDGKAVLYVVPVNTGASTTLDLLGLTAEEQIAATYTAFFGRAADAGGHGFWVGQFVQNLPSQGAAALFANIASSFGISAEAKALYPFLVDPFNATDAQISAFLDSVYNNLFNRSSDAGGLAYWTGAIKATLQAGQFVGSVLVNIMSGAQDSEAGKDITTLMGKVAVSLAFVHEQEEHGTVWSDASDNAAATNLLRTVTSDVSSVLIGVQNAETLIAAHA